MGVVDKYFKTAMGELKLAKENREKEFFDNFEKENEQCKNLYQKYSYLFQYVNSMNPLEMERVKEIVLSQDAKWIVGGEFERTLRGEGVYYNQQKPIDFNLLFRAWKNGSDVFIRDVQSGYLQSVVNVNLLTDEQIKNYVGQHWENAGSGKHILNFQEGDEVKEYMCKGKILVPLSMAFSPVEKVKNDLDYIEHLREIETDVNRRYPEEAREFFIAHEFWLSISAELGYRSERHTSEFLSKIRSMMQEAEQIINTPGKKEQAFQEVEEMNRRHKEMDITEWPGLGVVRGIGD